jgi:hypothetical protein
VGRKRERYEEEGSIGNEKAAGGNEKSFWFCYVWYSIHTCSMLLRFNSENGVRLQDLHGANTWHGAKTCVALPNAWRLSVRARFFNGSESTVVKSVEQTWIGHHVAEPVRISWYITLYPEFHIIGWDQ